MSETPHNPFTIMSEIAFNIYDPDDAGPDVSQTLEVGGIYVTLWHVSWIPNFHWGLFLALDTSSGLGFHYINQPWQDRPWAYEELYIHKIVISQNFQAGLKVSELVDTDEGTIEYLKTRLSKVTFQGEVGCRAWVKQALLLMAEEGFMGLPFDSIIMDAIEIEAMDLACRCEMAKKKGFKASGNYAA